MNLSHSYREGANFHEASEKINKQLGDGETYKGEKVYFHRREVYFPTTTQGTGPSKEAGDEQTAPLPYELTKRSRNVYSA